MKVLAKWIQNFIILSIYAWVALQFISAPSATQDVSADQLVPTFVEKWRELKTKHMVHGTILILQGNETIFQDGPLDKNYPLASISKTLTADVFRDKERQGLSLESPVCQWVKNFCRDGLQNVTLKHLLDHRSGLGRDLSFTGFLQRFVDPTWTLSKIDTTTISPEDLHFRPGENFEYSNFGYLVLSRILEIMDEESFSTIMASHYNAFSVRAIQPTGPYATNLMIPHLSAGTTMNLPQTLHKAAGAGGIAGTAESLATWMLKRDKDFFDRLFLVSSNQYAAGWARSQRQSYQAYWHNGATPGFYSLIAVIPEQRLRVVILTDNFKFIKHWSEQAEVFEKYFY